MAERPASFADLVAARIGCDADRPILTFVTIAADGSLSDETRTYAELTENGGRLARALVERGVAPGDRFAIMMNNHPEFVEAMIAAALTGATFVPIDSRTIGDKLAFMLDHAGCSGVIAADYCLDQVIAVAHAVPALRWSIVVGAGTPPSAGPLAVSHHADVIRGDGPPPPPAPIDPDAPMFLMFTSGTTGNPKAVEQSHRQYLVAAQVSAGLGLRGDDVFYTGLSLTHINAQGSLRNGLGSGRPVVISRKFTKSRLWDICRAYGCTTFNLLGGMIPEIFSMPPKPDDADNPVRLVISAGMPASLWNAYRERFGVEICEVYGSTEGGGAMFNPPGIGPVGSMGRPPQGWEAAVFDEADRRLGPGEAGELRFRRTDDRAIKVAYYRNDAASSAKTAGGWFRTGDIAHHDADGWFYFHHRAGGGVRRNGDFVNTAMVEAAISRSGLVDDVYVFGVATDRNVAGEKTLVAMVVPAEGVAFDAEALLGWCRAQLERNDVPEIIHAVAAIPKTVSEKPIERESVALLREARPDLV